jgi:undecaprenyl diphosphate synthase
MHYPKHVAIIPDGNRTRAKENNQSLRDAYRISYQRWLDLLEHTFKTTDIQAFTLRWISTENTAKRPVEEFDFLMNMYKQVDGRLDQILQTYQINFLWIGNPAGLSDWFKDYLEEKKKKYSFPTNKRFVFWANYGGRDEITRGIQKLAQEGKDLKNITEEDISWALDLSPVPPIELVVRTKGDQAHRTSGFMSWRIGYAELFFTAKRCPELDVPTYQESLNWFNGMAEKRNYGK